MTLTDCLNNLFAEDDINPLSPEELRVYVDLLKAWISSGRGEWFEYILVPNVKPKLKPKLKPKVIPKSTMVRIRDKLQERGLIQYVSGNGKMKKPYYKIVSETNPGTKGGTNPDTKPKEETSPTPPKEENIYINQQQLHTCTCEKNLEDLKDSLMKSDAWLESVRMALFRNYRMPLTEDQIKEKLSDFFLHLRSEGIEVKTEQDAKSHFKNWMAKVHEIETNRQNYGTENRRTYTSKQEANEYAFSQFIKYRQARESGLADEVEKPF